jgi:hypothetical protein
MLDKLVGKYNLTRKPEATYMHSYLEIDCSRFLFNLSHNFEYVKRI